MNKPSFLPACAAAMLLSTSALAGVEKVFKYDQFSDDPVTAKDEIPMVSVSCQPGFAKGEAYGILIVPDPKDYPFDILRVEFLQADTTNDPAGDKQNIVTIQVYNDDSAGAEPTGAPIFEITSGQIVDPVSMKPQHVQEGVFMQYAFDPTGDPQLHPKTITSGNVRVMVQFDDQDVAFPTIQGCEGLGGFGCQDPCALADEAATPKGNLIRTVTNAWLFNEAAGVKGDWIFRVVVDSSDTGQGAGGAGGAGGASSGTGGDAGAGGSSGSDPCDIDADCPEMNQVCQAHVCKLAPECVADADCAGADQVCSANKCQSADSGGCGCETAERTTGGGALMVLFAGIGVLVRRRGQRSSKPSRRA